MSGSRQPTLKGRFKRVRTIVVTEHNLEAIADLLGINKEDLQPGNLHIVQGPVTDDTKGP